MWNIEAFDRWYSIPKVSADFALINYDADNTPIYDTKLLLAHLATIEQSVTDIFMQYTPFTLPKIIKINKEYKTEDISNIFYTEIFQFYQIEGDIILKS